MSFNDMLTDFQNILNRSDCDNDLATTFLSQGIGRVQRECRLPSMERSLIITPTTPMQSFPVPPDLIQIIDVLAFRGPGSAPVPLRHVDFRILAQSLSDHNALPTMYARMQAQIWIAGAAPAGKPLLFTYFGNFSPFETPDSENELSASTPDLGVYAALRYAGDHFSHPMTGQWEQTYQDIRNQVQQMANDLNNEGGINEITPMFSNSYSPWIGPWGA